MTNIIDAREQGHSIGHDIGKALSGYGNPVVAKHKAAYRTLEHMRPGDITRVEVGQPAYLLAVFPAEMPATSLVLFIK